MITALAALLAALMNPAHIPRAAAVQRAPVVLVRDMQSLTRISGLPHAPQTNAQRMNIATSPPAHTAQAVLVVDAENESVLYEENADTLMPLASITKLASALTALREGLNLQQSTTIIEEDVIETQSAINVGDVIANDDLLGLALVGSSNSAAHTLARAVGMSVEEFVERMNTTGKELGLTHAVFVESTGLDPRNKGTARDAYRLLMAAYRNETLAPMLAKPEHVFSNGAIRKKVYSTNIFKLGIIPFAGDTILAAKTGHIPEAGFHFAMIARDARGAVRPIIVLGAADHFARFTEADALLSWTTDNAYADLE